MVPTSPDNQGSTVLQDSEPIRVIETLWSMSEYALINTIIFLKGNKYHMFSGVSIEAGNWQTSRPTFQIIAAYFLY